MERVEISAAELNLPAIINQVRRDRVPIELSDGQVPVARIVPIEKTHSMAELEQALRTTSRLGTDSEDFARDVLSVRQDLGELDDPWGS